MKFLFILFSLFFLSFELSAKEKIELVVPYGAGGGTDLLARRIANVVVNDKFELNVTNRVGGAANIAFNYFVGNKKVLLLVGNQIIENERYAKDGFPADILSEAKPVFFVSEGPQLLYTSLDVKDLKEMIELSKTKDIVFGANAPGTGSYEIYDMLCNVMKAFKNCNMVTYSSSSAAIPDLLAKRVDVYANSFGAYDRFTSTGKAKVIAVIGPKRFYGVPEALTFKEVGYDIEIVTWLGLFQKGLSTQELEALNKDIKKLMTIEEHRKYAYDVIDSEPSKFFKDEILKFKNKK